MKPLYGTATACLLSFLTFTANSQVEGGHLESQTTRVINALETIKFAGGRFSVDAVIDMDSARCSGCIDQERIETNHASLRGCLLFLARGVDASGFGSLRKHIRPFGDSLDVFGIYRRGGIAWLSDPIDGKFLRSQFLATSDLLGDGNVEILVNMLYGDRQGSYETKVFKWDGTRGGLVSDNTVEEVYNVVDLDGDGVKELLGKESDDELQKDVVYKWDGSKFTRKPVSSNLTGKPFTAADNFVARIRARIEMRGSQRSFIYSILNDSRSRQSIRYFFLPHLIDSVHWAQPDGWSPSISPDGSFTGFGADPKDSSGQHYIKPGTELGGFEMSCDGLPRIVPYYLQASFSPLNPTSAQERRIFATMKSNVLTNSVTGSTIGAAAPESKFVASAFVDTLASDVSRSRSLSWIKSQAVGVRYLEILRKVKTNLLHAKTDTACDLLRQLLKQVSIDKSASLTSEAYALLRFNSEYMLSQLAAIQHK